MNKNNAQIKEEEFLKSYDITKFDRPSVTVDILLLSIIDEETNNYRKLPEKNLEVLLIRRLEHPYKDKWALPGGFVRIKESLETTAYRELQEETNVSGIYLEQLYTYGNLERDPRGRIISTAYMSLVDSQKLTVKPGTDSIDTKWFKISINLINSEREVSDSGIIEFKDHELILTHNDIILKAVIRTVKKISGNKVETSKEIILNNDIAFDHADIILYGIERLRNKIEYSSIVFNLMPSTFTLSELQKVYEAILDKDLLKANFRRKVSKMVTETNKSTGANIGHRPAKLFTFNSSWE